MKRSELNKIMRDAVEFIKQHNFAMPPFVTWTMQEWETKNEEYDEIKENMLGWDITDFGSGDFNKEGLLMITLRNGNLHDTKYKKSYAEKLLISEEGQVTPYHFHWQKMEDIINRGGGTLVLRCYNSGEKGEKLDTPVTVYMDGRKFVVPAGERIEVHVGESITLPTGQYHTFWAEGGKCLIGEVSRTNDDNVDNRFYDKLGRFPTIEEDEPILYPLFSEYPNMP
ncbi:MAG: D-lyxose/D-mannose family sugar isomerase [Oscillospiraceae bacterium]